MKGTLIRFCLERSLRGSDGSLERSLRGGDGSLERRLYGRGWIVGKKRLEKKFSEMEAVF